MDKYLIRKKTTESEVISLSTAESCTVLNFAISPNDELRTTPSDISKSGDPIFRNILKSYPKNSDGRSFQADWFRRFKWIEYSKSQDAIFCYACRQFEQQRGKETVFTENGFRNWKSALDKSKAGLVKHAASVIHITAMSKWNEREYREEIGMSVSTILNENALERNRYYVRSLIEVIQFLAINELSMRGTYCIEEHEEKSLFKNLFEYTLRKDDKLRQCYKFVPKNACYLSPEIQNELIALLAETIREDIVKDIKAADVPFFTILEDGTRDKNNRENIAIGIRYVKDGKVFESILKIETINAFDALSFAKKTLETLQECGLKTSNILSQCYDGASVMSGKNGGVQAVIQQKLGRKIPYVHCFNHRLHLVVIKTVSEIDCLRQYFDYCSVLHNFLSKGKVTKLYEGKTLSRLLEQRWSGHFQVTKVVYSNFKEIKDVLVKVQTENFSGEDIASSIGILTVLQRAEFRFCLVFMKKILGIIFPADKLLQGRQTSLQDAISIIQSVKETLLKLRNDKTFKELLEESNQFSGESENILNYFESEPRKRKVNKRLQDFIVTEKVTLSYPEVPSQAMFYETIDMITEEMNRRFLDNDGLFEAITAAENFEIEDCKLNQLGELGIVIPSEEELEVVKSYLKRREEKKQSKDIFEEIYKQRVAFEDTYKLLAAVRTFACSTAICESSFSTLTRLNHPQRLSMSHDRLASLVFLAFEKERTEKIDLDKILHKFNSLKYRKLQLF